MTDKFRLRMFKKVQAIFSHQTSKQQILKIQEYMQIIMR